MLVVTLPKSEFFNEQTETFIDFEPVTVTLEHSLVSLSKWESKFEKPFLTSTSKTQEEIFAYVEFMILDETIPEKLPLRLSAQNLSDINQYIDSKQTATTFRETKRKAGPKEVVTAELVYYWMIAFNIPFECQHWHLNRLFALVQVCNIKTQPPSKMSKHEIAQRNRELNAKRKAELGTTG